MPPKSVWQWPAWCVRLLPHLIFMKEKLFICFALFAAILIGVSCGEASAQSKKDVYEKRVDEGSNEFYVDHHSDKDHQRNKKDRDDKDWDPKRKYDLLEKEIWEAVKAGKISERDAKEKLEGLREEMFGDHDKDHHHHHAERHEQEDHHHEQNEHGMAEVMIAVKVLKHAVETGRMEHHHAKDMLWDLLAGEDKEHHHGEEHHRHHEEERERKDRHHEEERERKDRHHKEDREREDRHHEGEHDEKGEEALYEALARGLEAAVELGKLSEEEAKEIWRDMTGDEDQDEEEDD